MTQLTQNGSCKSQDQWRLYSQSGVTKTCQTNAHVVFKTAYVNPRKTNPFYVFISNLSATLNVTPKHRRISKLSKSLKVLSKHTRFGTLTSAPSINFHQNVSTEDVDAKERKSSTGTKPIRSEHSLTVAKTVTMKSNKNKLPTRAI